MLDKDLDFNQFIFIYLSVFAIIIKLTLLSFKQHKYKKE
ncbi:hypothetical protein B4145_4586 [Bacillus subtilis]|uniref:Uncharacterized protein n=1 Tax=Bacillus subtilis subsp. subtilis TaxID=135461 RepID=A0ABD3ZXY8_BACIU|nr:hypothetical protein B4067_4712 [Bacillus subtilis subsp. subtilis]KIN57454.1 hypothetical protein B4145_4586 [Bacillus subtilis]